MWKRLRHPNIVHFIGVTIEPFQLVSEWIPNGVLTDYITKNPDANRIALVSPISTITTNQHKLSFQLLDVAEGLNYLHVNYMIHGDFKGVGALSKSSQVTLPTLGQPNILIKSDGHACLADFGLASIVHGNDSIVPIDVPGYSARWTAPEILNGAEKSTREADVFSFGMVVMEVSPRVFRSHHQGWSEGHFFQYPDPVVGLHGETSAQWNERPLRYDEDHSWREASSSTRDGGTGICGSCMEHDSWLLAP